MLLLNLMCRNLIVYGLMWSDNYLLLVVFRFFVLHSIFIIAIIMCQVLAIINNFMVLEYEHIKPDLE